MSPGLWPRSGARSGPQSQLRMGGKRCLTSAWSQALLIYNLIGEAMYLPFGGKDKNGDEEKLQGILTSTFAALNATGLLALLANGNARRQFRDQFPEEYAQLCERSLNQNDIESGFGVVASQVAASVRACDPRGDV